MKKLLKEKNKIIIGLIFGLVLIALWLKFIDVSQMVNYFKKVNPLWIIASMVLYLSAYFIRSIRWQIILSPVEKISVKQAFNLFMAGMLVNYIIPIRAGEIAKSFFLKGLKKTPVSKSLPTVFIDKMMDLFPIIILLLLLPFVPIRLSSFLIWGLMILLVIFLVFVGIIIISLYYSVSVSNWLKIWFFWLPKRFKSRVNDFIHLFVEGLGVVKENKNNAGSIILLTILAILFDAGYIIGMFQAFDYQIAFLVALFGYTLINLSYILPTPPAQIGTNEAIYIIIFTFAFGIDKNLVSATLGFAHLLTGSLIFLVGSIALQYLNSNLIQALSLNHRT